MKYGLTGGIRVALVIATLLGWPMSVGAADEPVAGGAVTLNMSFAGGNAKVVKNDGADVHVEPDLRGDRPWFYWYFEATATRAGRVTFHFPEKVIGFKDGAIGFQGPAMSTDGGQTWRWMGTRTVSGSRFYYDFAKRGESVRFAVTIPYLQSEWDAFIKRHADNPHIKQSVLTKSRAGRDVELLQVGQDRPGVQRVLITARHHAAETMASYLFEGFIEEAMSDSSAGKAFRQKYVMYAVPFVDKDGVEAGDQGKNRRPHDHNRDYSDKSIYPEVQAIMALDRKVRFNHALDFHCPTLVMDIHQVMYFIGAKGYPPNNLANVTAFAKQIKERLPKTAPVGPLVWLRDENQRSPKNSRYFAFQEGVIVSATFEFPFAPTNRKTDTTSCREYGRIMLRAWVATSFK